mgnify:CR=1 FL=1
MKKVLRRNMSIVFVIYTLVGTFGYITFASDVSVLDATGNILLNYISNPIPIVIVNSHFLCNCSFFNTGIHLDWCGDHAGNSSERQAN